MIIFLTLIISFNVHATCIDDFLSLIGRKQPLEEIVAVDYSDKFRQNLSLSDFSADTYHAVEIIKGKYSQKFRVKKNSVNSEWKGLFPTDPQGEPNWTKYLLTEEGARGLGFQYLKDSIVFPSAHELMVGYEALKKSSPLYLPFSFYPSTNMHNENYLKRFAYEGAFPMAEVGRVYSHDIHFHMLSSFLASPEYIDTYREYVKIYLDFNAYLKEHAPVEYKKYLKAILANGKDVVSKVDVAFGGIAYRVVTKFDSNGELDEAEAVNALRVFFKGKFNHMNLNSVSDHLREDFPNAIENLEELIKEFVSKTKPEISKLKSVDQLTTDAFTQYLNVQNYFKINKLP